MKIVAGQRPAHQQRERHHSQLQNIRPLIDQRQARRSRNGHPELSPQSIFRELQLFERRAQNMFDDDEARIRRDDDAFGTERSVRCISRVLVECCHRGHELPDEAQRRVASEDNVLLRRRREQIREANARHGVGDQRQGACRIGEPLDASNLGEVGMAEVCQAADALAQREFERGNGRQLAVQAENVERLAPGGG
jgi:hypothetical protein